MSAFVSEWRYHKGGRPDGIPVLFLHGFMGAGGDWTTIISGLEDIIYGIAPDLPGHGKTRADLSRLDFDSLADALAEFAVVHLARPPILAGYSMGGRVALYTVLKHPENFSSLILASTTAGIADEQEREKRLLLDQARAEKLRASGLQAFLSEWYRQPIFESLRLRPEVAETMAREKSENDVESLAQVMVRLSPGRQPSLWADLSRWEKPALVIAGERDAQYCRLAQQMAALFPRAELRLLPDAGHPVHRENPIDFATALKFFISAYIL
jgi:2-succinyl-6-hydroxy-2,4-cyclohexadiene-1-carboxylate synthase